eukprot:1091609-Prymnesium_polylepis.1
MPARRSRPQTRVGWSRSGTRAGSPGSRSASACRRRRSTTLGCCGAPMAAQRVQWRRRSPRWR